jgi:hypothetical protein
MEMSVLPMPAQCRFITSTPVVVVVLSALLGRFLKYKNTFSR